MDEKCNHHSSISCVDCRMSALCLPLALHSGEINKLDEIIQRNRPCQKDDHIYYAGTPFKSVYAVRSGCIKTYTVNSKGQEQVTGFYLPGEIFGMDGIGGNQYTNYAVALETAAICEIPFSRFEDLSESIPALKRHFLQLMGQEITNEQQLIGLLAKSSAEERLAALLLSFSTRNASRKLSGTHIRLPMSRADIGNYLGLTVETVSRVFSRFQKQGILTVDKKEIAIIDMDGLHAIASTE